MSRIRRMLALSITLVTAFLCVFTPVRVFALTTPSIIATVNNMVVISSVDMEYITDSGTQTFRMTGSFTLPDATITTADPVYSGTCIPASGTTTSQNMQSCSLTPRVNGVNTTYGHHVSTLTYDDTDVSLTLTSSGSSNVITKIYYQKEQRIYAILDGYVTGEYWFPFQPGDGWSWSSFIYEPLNDNMTCGWYTLDGVQGVRVVVSNSNIVGFKVRRVFENQTSISTAVLGSCNVWNGKWLNVKSSEFPVSDFDSHTTLNNILQLLNQNSGTSSTNNAINDATSDLVDQGDLMHGTEVNLQNAMDTSLSDPALNVDINQKIQSDSKVSSSFNWVGTQLTNIVQGFNDITPYWEFMFIMPLVLGIGLLIIGRLR